MRKWWANQVAVLAGVMLAGSVANAAIIELPGIDETYDGIPVALQYNDFYSYSGSLLYQWGFLTQNQYTGQGTGSLDLIVGTGSSGQDNQNIGPGGSYSFESPMPFPSGNTSEFDGTWGMGTQANGPVLVDNLLAYLDAINPGATIPTFIFDHNQTGGSPDLWVQAEVFIYDPETGERVARWIFDDGNGNPALSPGNVEVIGESGTVYEANANVGSGRLDYIVFAPTMDLSLFAGAGYLFGIDFFMNDLNNGFEELYLSGRFTNGTPVSLPGSFLLLGLGLALLVLVVRRRGRAGPAAH
ncbi:MULTISPECIES: hypothetical protein [unclassified Thioalkalivibrio]|uniref:hypothetical protein n=1 Tax=unclassified Thioalkalivibrio TaxID=2621013 RepID=UPI0003679985|nr:MULTISPECIES: hypothetical protein [unclassified Thioalkalivibrio]